MRNRMTFNIGRHFTTTHERGGGGGAINTCSASISVLVRARCKRNYDSRVAYCHGEVLHWLSDLSSSPPVFKRPLANALAVQLKNPFPTSPTRTRPIRLGCISAFFAYRSATCWVSVPPEAEGDLGGGVGVER